MPHPGASGPGQGDAVDEPLPTELGQPAPRLLDPCLGREDQVHLCGGGHPVLDQHRQRQPVPTTGVDVRHRRLPRTATPLPVGRRAYEAGHQPAPTTPPTTKARPRSRCDNTAVDRADIPADNCFRPACAHLPKAQVTTPLPAWSTTRHPLRAHRSRWFRNREKEGEERDRRCGVRQGNRAGGASASRIGRTALSNRDTRSDTYGRPRRRSLDHQPRSARAAAASALARFS